MLIIQRGLCAVLFLLHLAMTVQTLRSADRLGTQSSDQKRDPLYSVASAFAAHGFVLLIQAYGLWMRWLDPGSSLAIYGGSAIFALGLTLRLWAIRTLGRLFTMEIGIRDEHSLVIEGPFRWMRHPSYSGHLLLLIGIGIAYQSPLVFIVPLLGSIVFMILRIPQEEAMLTGHFQDQYREYQKRTKRLIPFLF